MNDHLAPESLSAYLDGELDERERGRADQHLGSCPDCSGALSALAAAIGSVASLGPVTVTADEHRELRQAVLKSRTSASRLGFRVPQWALAGGLVLVAVTVLAISFLRPGDSGQQEALTEAAAPAVGGPAFNFSTGEEVDRTVAGLPEVAAGLNRYRAGDSEEARDGDGDPATAADSYAGATAGDSGGQAPPPRSAPVLVNPAPES
ncbi:MAG: zf-HC2 domain-containing protein, partial [Actinomycetota bacterium]